jgi:hypothetical protein
MKCGNGRERSHLGTRAGGTTQAALGQQPASDYQLVPRLSQHRDSDPCRDMNTLGQWDMSPHRRAGIVGSCRDKNASKQGEWAYVGESGQAGQGMGRDSQWGVRSGHMGAVK